MHQYKENKIHYSPNMINKYTRNVRPFAFYRTESRRFFPDRHIVIKAHSPIITAFEPMVEKSVILQRIKVSRVFPRVLATELCRGTPKDFEIKFVLNNGRNKSSFSCPWHVGYDISPLSRVKLKILTIRRHVLRYFSTFES